MMGDVKAPAVAQAFATMCQEQARWREGKHDEYSDERNLRCAAALRAAATWAQTAEDAEERLSELLPRDIAQPGVPVLLLNEQARQVFSTYCFHSPEPLDRWLRRVADAHYDEEYDDELSELLGTEGDD